MFVVIHTPLVLLLQVLDNPIILIFKVMLQRAFLMKFSSLLYANNVKKIC